MGPGSSADLLATGLGGPCRRPALPVVHTSEHRRIPSWQRPGSSPHPPKPGRPRSLWPAPRICRAAWHGLPPPGRVARELARQVLSPMPAAWQGGTGERSRRWRPVAAAVCRYETPERSPACQSWARDGVVVVRCFQPIPRHCRHVAAQRLSEPSGQMRTRFWPPKGRSASGLGHRRDRKAPGSQSSPTSGDRYG